VELKNVLSATGIDSFVAAEKYSIHKFSGFMKNVYLWDSKFYMTVTE
jgi:hypothetical protein